MPFIEITGQPCAGKSSFIAQEVLCDKNIQKYEQTFFMKMLSFYWGVRYLGLKKSKVLLSWSLRENGSLFFRINIFRNAVLKFGNFQRLTRTNVKNPHKFLVDEGLSHLSFLFLNTDTHEVVDFVSDELKSVQVKLLKSPGHEVIKARLITRGHKRLKFVSLNCFTKRNQDIEDILLNRYPKLCKDINSI